MGQKKYTDAEPLLLAGYEGTELNYRTSPDAETEIPFTTDALKFAVGVSVVAAIAVRFLVPEYLGYAAVALFGMVWWFVPDSTRPDSDAPSRTGGFRLWLFAVLVGCVALHATVPPLLAGYLVAFPCAGADLSDLLPDAPAPGRRPVAA